MRSSVGASFLWCTAAVVIFWPALVNMEGELFCWWAWLTTVCGLVMPEYGAWALVWWWGGRWWVSPAFWVCLLCIGADFCLLKMVLWLLGAYGEVHWVAVVAGFLVLLSFCGTHTHTSIIAKSFQRYDTQDFRCLLLSESAVALYNM